MSTVRYRLATSPDRGAIVALLEAESLPTADLETSGVILIVAVSGQRCIGCVGVQPSGDAALIRSLAVARGERGAGIGRTLVSRAEALAAAGGVHSLFLLTESAKDFWINAGYAIVARADAPAEVQDSAEFRSLCPDTAVCMKRALAGFS